MLKVLYPLKPTCHERPCFIAVAPRAKTQYASSQQLNRCRVRLPARVRRLCRAPRASAGTGAVDADATIVCVGDIHGQWGPGDERALEALKPDLVLFVGDYGDEAAEITARIGALAERAPFGVATVFGNHDAWYTAHAYGRSRAPSYGSRVAMQQEHLASVDASYRAR
eukprot:IDg16232t1